MPQAVSAVPFRYIECVQAGLTEGDEDSRGSIRVGEGLMRAAAEFPTGLQLSRPEQPTPSANGGQDSFS